MKKQSTHPNFVKEYGNMFAEISLKDSKDQKLAIDLTNTKSNERFHLEVSNDYLLAKGLNKADSLQM